MTDRTLLRAFLISSRLGRHDVDEAADAEPSFSYTAAIESLQRRDDYTLIFSILKIEKQVGGKAAVDFSAIYLFGYSGDRFESEEAEFSFVENLVEVVVWPRFCDLCEITVWQAELDFPRLPKQPHSITRPKPREDS